MLTRSAQLGLRQGHPVATQAFSIAELRRDGHTASAIRAQLAAGRWQRVGLAIVTHNGEPTVETRRWAALINCGPRSVLAAFTAAQALGLQGWERDAIHLLAPTGTDDPQVPGLPIRLHRTGRPMARDVVAVRRCQRMGPALVLAAATVRRPRVACGLLAAGVQQRLVTAPQLLQTLAAATRTRHRAVLIAATRDIAMGAQALSEIDFIRLCRRHRLPLPRQQAVRTDPQGRRRYLDALWELPGGRRLVAEVDGGLHLIARNWWSDQYRQNELVLARTSMLRFPSIVVRAEERTVVDQLRRGLLL